MPGAPYAAGGIHVTTDATGAATDAELAVLAGRRRDERLRAGITDNVTFLGAHRSAAEYEGRADAYVELVVGDMLAAGSTYSASAVRSCGSRSPSAPRPPTTART